MPSRNESFSHAWRAEILLEPPLIAPARQYVYPQQVEEVERGALQVQVVPKEEAPFLATFALGFAEPSLPHGIWSCPDPHQICAVAGGYAYIVNVRQPDVWQQVPYRPVTALCVVPTHRLLVFAGFHSLCALGSNGSAWETERLSWEGLRITDVEPDTLSGLGWDLMTDTEVPFTVELQTGRHSGGAGPH
ncbi:MAG TPA: hypothetical protein VHX63_12560 [Acidobacteriaceae bacterium]|nr:hypothetical protein [Acidobacteriaceae bacterium]